MPAQYEEAAMCPHFPRCPGPNEPHREAARTAAAHPEQGWTLLCNGLVIFDDTGLLLPDGRAVGPSRELPRRHVPASQRAA